MYFPFMFMDKNNGNGFTISESLESKYMMPFNNMDENYKV